MPDNQNSVPQGDAATSDASSATSESSHEEEDKASESTTDEAQVVDKKEHRIQKIEGKLQQEQEEKKKLQEEKDQLQARFSRVENYLSSDPDRLYQALLNTSGKGKDEVVQVMKQSYPEWKGPDEEPDEEDVSQETTQPTQPAQPVQPVDPLYQQAAASAIEKEKRIMERKGEAAEKYKKDNPKITPREYGIVLGIAEDIMEKAELEGERIPPEDAIKSADERFFKTDKLIKEAEERGENRGLAEASSIASSVRKSPVGTASKTEAEPDVPEAEWRLAQETGNFKSKAEYVFYRDNLGVSVE